MLQLRPRQDECLDAVLGAYNEGMHQQLVVMATGCGKAVLIANIPAKMRHLLPGKMLVFVHTEELVKQLIETCKSWNPELKVGREQAQFYADTDCDIIVSCVASIGREGATRLQRFGDFDIIVCDEAHHSIASSYLNVFDMVGVLKPDTRKLLVGFTATPKRKNIRKKKKQVTSENVGDPTAQMTEDEELISLKNVYQKIVFTYPIRKAIKEGWLVPLKGFRFKTDTDLSEVKTTAGDYQQDALSEAVNTPKRNQQVVKFWLDTAERRTTIAFTVDIQHAKDLSKAFCAAGVKAEAIWGTNPERNNSFVCSVCNDHLDAEAEGNANYLGKPCRTRLSTFCTGTYFFKEGIINRFKKNEYEVLCNCGVLIEGFDAWNVMAVLDAGPTKSSSKYTQKIGRGTRLEEGTGNLLEALKAGRALLKKDCYILDVVDNNKRCSLVTLPSLLGLNPDFDLHGESVTRAIDEVEALQEKYPDVNFDHLTDLSQVKVYVESLDLFAEPYTQEVKEFSKLRWMQTQDGSFVLTVPEKREVTESKQYWNFMHEKMHITTNELDEYELSITTVNEDRKLGVFNSLQEVFATADEVIRRCRPDRLKLLQRESSWHSGTASDASKKYLKRLLGKNKPFIYCTCPVGPKCSGIANTTCQACNKQQLTAGQVSLAINKFKS
jgi:superfamily II DNA or RNA helicase